jgi:hypothetical protein
MNAIKITRSLIVLSLVLGVGLGVAMSQTYSPWLTTLFLLDLGTFFGLCVLADKLVHQY